MTDRITAGNKGPKVHLDCYVEMDAARPGPLAIQVTAPDSEMDTTVVEDGAKAVCDTLGLRSGHIYIEDSGAREYVLAARIEACCSQVASVENSFLPEITPQNTTATTKSRMRLSRLYLPGNTPKLMERAGSYQPQTIILDLEDAVAPAKKPEARLLVRNALRQMDFNGAERMVRINQLPMGLDDLDYVVPHGVQVILIPKCESAETVRQVNERIDALAREAQVAPEIFLMPIIESARGVLNAESIAGAADNIVALTIGLEDYTADLGVVRTVAGTESLYARSHLVTVCKAFGIQAIDSVFSDFGDEAGLKATVQRSKALGFEGMGCIHPCQIGPVHAGFAPTGDQVEKAKQIVRAFEMARHEGISVVSLGSKMIDPPVVARAQHTIAMAVALGQLVADWNEKGKLCGM